MKGALSDSLEQSERVQLYSEVDLKLHIKPKQTGLSWKQFVSEAPPFSIALDGYVAEKVREDFRTPRANYNHHEHCNRMSTRATCAQIWMSIRQGLYNIFRDENGPRVEIFANDCDEDVSASIIQLKRPDLVLNDKRRRFERLIDMFDKMDTTSGTYRLDLDSKDAQSMFWITDPYRESRVNGDLDKADAKAYEDIIAEVGRRIERYINGTQRSIKVDASFKEIGGGEGWVMIEEQGKQGRLGAIAKGHQAIVSVRPLPNGNYCYTFTRISTNVQQFDLPVFIATLNQIEQAEYGENFELKDRWGGSDTVIGSPRENGSCLPPETVGLLVKTMINGLGIYKSKGVPSSVARPSTKSLQISV